MMSETFMKNLNVQLPEPLHAPDFGSYSGSDVQWLLKDLSDYSIEAPTEEREELIQSGEGHYSETLPIEYQPSEEYVKLFLKSLGESKLRVATAIGVVSEQLLKARGSNLVIVSLARAGVPVGILIKRYLKAFHNIDPLHYAVSIVRGRGIDENALTYITNHHAAEDVIFVDGWTGKGAITKELKTAVDKYNGDHNTCLSSEMAVLADPAYCVRYYGTREDYLIPSACLNSTVSGLISRTVLNDLIGGGDYHGAKFYKEFTANDYSNLFIDTVSDCFNDELHGLVMGELKTHEAGEVDWRGWKSLEKINEEFEIGDMNLIKPGVGETTRVLLRRVPWRILINPDHEKDLQHILLLAKQRGVEVMVDSSLPYSCIGIIHPKYTKGAVGSDGGRVK